MGLISIAILGAIVYAVVRYASSTDHRSGADIDPVAGVEPWLARWVDAELLTTGQAEAIRAHERALGPPAPPAPDERASRIPVVAEAVGYLGGTLAIVGLGLVLQRFWSDVPLAGRLALVAAIATSLLVGGRMVPEEDDPALARLRWSLWFLATGATGTFAGIAVADGLPTDAAETIAVAVSAAVLVPSAALWRGRGRPLQQLTTLLAALALAASTMANLGGGAVVGTSIWVVGAAILSAGLRRWADGSIISEGVGSLAVVVGAAVVSSGTTGAGLLFLVGTALGLCALATVPGVVDDRPAQVLIGLVGAMALLQASSATIGWFGTEAGGLTGLVTWMLAASIGIASSALGLRLAKLIQVVAAAYLLVGAGITGLEWAGFAPLFGIATAVALVAVGMLPEQVPLSVLGSIGLLVFVPWAIGWFFPGENRAPVLILVTGALLIGLAVLLTRPRSLRRP